MRRNLFSNKWESEALRFAFVVVKSGGQECPPYTCLHARAKSHSAGGVDGHFSKTARSGAPPEFSCVSRQRPARVMTFYADVARPPSLVLRVENSGEKREPDNAAVGKFPRHNTSPGQLFVIRLITSWRILRGANTFLKLARFEIDQEVCTA